MNDAKDPVAVDPRMTQFLNKHNTPVLRLDAVGRAVAAERMKQAHKGIWDKQSTLDGAPDLPGAGVPNAELREGNHGRR
jgi:hypothetical protein